MTHVNRLKLTVILVGGAAVALAVWTFSLGMWFASARQAPVQTVTLAASDNPQAGATPQKLIGGMTEADMDKAAASFEIRHPPLPVPSDYPQVVPFAAGKTQFIPGDKIAITEVRGATDSITVGQVYRIKGTYTLASRDNATLSVYVTAKHREDGIGRPQSVQSIYISKGSGEFTLILPMRCEGWPHVSMYASGEDSSCIYFGTGDTVWKQ